MQGLQSLVNQRQAAYTKTISHNIQYGPPHGIRNILSSGGLDQGTEPAVLVDLSDFKTSELPNFPWLYYKLNRYFCLVQNRFSDERMTALGFGRYDVTNRIEDSKGIFVRPSRVGYDTDERDLFWIRGPEEVRERD